MTIQNLAAENTLWYRMKKTTPNTKHRVVPKEKKRIAALHMLEFGLIEPDQKLCQCVDIVLKVQTQVEEDENGMESRVSTRS